MKCKEYMVYYRKRREKDADIFNCTVTTRTKKEAKENFEQWDNEYKEWAIVKIEEIK